MWKVSWRRGQTATLAKFFWPWQKFFLILTGFAQPWVTKGLKPSVCRWLSLRDLVPNCLEPSVHLVILLSNVHLLPLFFRLFTQVHLLIDSSVEGQYITRKGSPRVALNFGCQLYFTYLRSATCFFLSLPLPISLSLFLSLMGPSFLHWKN